MATFNRYSVLNAVRIAEGAFVNPVKAEAGRPDADGEPPPRRHEHCDRGGLRRSLGLASRSVDLYGARPVRPSRSGTVE